MKDERKAIVNCAYVIDREYHITHYNLAIKKIYPDLEIGDICYRKLQGEDFPCKVCPLKTPKKEGLLYYNRLKKAWVDCMAAPLDLVTGTEDHVVICHTITEMREDQREQALRLLAGEGKERDSLTGLYNRETFFLKVDAMLQAARASEYCLIALDVENFKLYNTLYGFSQGNDYLHYIGYSMKEVLKNNGFAGYIGEDNFAAFLPNRQDILTNLAERLKFYIDSREQNPGFYPAIGIYVIDDVAATVEKIYDRASTARTLLRGNHLSRMIWYDESMIRELEENYTLLNELKHGLKQDEFTFYLQPKCDMRDKRIVGMEALCRWQHPEKGLLGPGSFVPQMETNGLITDLDCRIWEKVCIMLKHWKDTGKKLLPVSVNVSRIDFFELNVVKVLEDLVARYDVPKQYLEIEVTESAYAENEMIVKRAIDKLRASGFTVSMDDFGSGYSSLNMLQNVSVDILKLDMRFLQLEDDAEERGIHILEMIVQLAKSLHIKIIAEGVESERQRKVLLRMGCGYAQGYFYFRPMAVEDAERLLEEAVIGEMQNTEEETGEAASATGLDTEKLITQLYRLSEKYRAAQQRSVIYETAMRDYFDERIELDYRNCGSDEATKNVLALFGKRWKLPFAAKERLHMALRPDTVGDPNEIAVKKERLFTEDNRELMIFVLFIDSHKVLLFVRDQGQATFEKVMLQHPLLWGYDYDVEQDVLQITSGNGEDGVKTVRVESFQKNMRSYDLVSRESFHRVKKEIKKAVQTPTDGVIEFETGDARGERLWKRLYYLSLANQRGKVYRIVGMAGNIEMEHKSAESWKDKANRDQMTGFLNHEAAIYYMGEALEEAGGGTLLSLDIDNFKRINDTVGHMQGDACIQRLAELLRHTFRRGDLFGRMGGDEFLIFMPEVTQPEISKQRIQEFFLKLEQIRIPRVGEIKCSVGIACSSEPGMTISSLLKQADYALYEAKNAGKGHVVCIEEGRAKHYGIQAPDPQTAMEAADKRKTCEFIGELFLIMYHAATKSEGIDRALAYIGERLDVSRVYIFAFENDEGYARNTYEWCADGVAPEIDHLQRVEFRNLGFDLNNYYEDDMWFCPDVSMVREPGMRGLLEEQSIKGMLHWLFRRNGRVVGMIGFDECRDNVNWSTQYADVLRHAGEVLSNYILSGDP